MGNLPFDATEDVIRSFIEENVEKHSLETRGVKGSGSVKVAKEEGSDEEEEDGSSDDEDGNEEEDEDQEEANAPIANPRSHIPTSACGLKKVRMPTFEDSGKCKG